MTRKLVGMLLILGLTAIATACAPSANPPKESPSPTPTSS